MFFYALTAGGGVENKVFLYLNLYLIGDDT